MEGDRIDGLTKPSFSGSDEPEVMKVGSSLTDVAMASGSGCFDCNICLDFVTDPVVTLCGHLYCWPCLYKWLSPASAAGVEDGVALQRRRCPVCKAAISTNDVVPLYGRGHSGGKLHHALGIPCRPTVRRQSVVYQTTQNRSDTESRLQLHPLHHHHQHGHQYPDRVGRFAYMSPSPPLGHGLAYSMAGELLGGMVVAVLPWALRGHMLPAGMEVYYQNLLQMTRSNMSPRLRLQQIAAERLLHHLWFFLLVFVVLCLLLF